MTNRLSFVTETTSYISQTWFERRVLVYLQRRKGRQ